MTYGDYLRTLSDEDMADFIANTMETLLLMCNAEAEFDTEAYKKDVLKILKEDIEDDC